jgi:hypothetical protein
VGRIPKVLGHDDQRIRNVGSARQVFGQTAKEGFYFVGREIVWGV